MVGQGGGGGERRWGEGGRLFEAGRLLTFFTFRVGAYLRWALIRGWALNRINTVFQNYALFMGRISVVPRNKLIMNNINNDEFIIILQVPRIHEFSNEFCNFARDDFGSTKRR